MPERQTSSQLVSDLLSQWDADVSREGHDPLPFLTNLTEIVEQEAILFWKHNPDPFDDRHPSKVNSDCQYGAILKKIFRSDGFIQRMIDNYCTARGEPGPVQTMAVRLLLSMLPGVESSVFFRDNEEIVERLYDWAEKQPRDSEVRAYAIGILGSAMQAELSINFREANQRIASAVLEELWQIVSGQSCTVASPGMKRPSSQLNGDGSTDEPSAKKGRVDSLNMPFASTTVNGHADEEVKAKSMKPNRPLLSPPLNPAEENSSMLSNIACIIGDNTLYPVTTNVRQRLYLQFLSPVAQYQDLLAVMTKYNVMSLVDNYLDMRRVGDARLTFEALCLLASLLCHRKLASEFIQQQSSVSRLLSSVPRTTLPAAGVALCLYYLSYFEHTANRLCTSLSRPVLLQLMEYALGLVQAGYLSSKNHAALFLAAMLPYNQILEVFDACNGISYLYNSLSTLAIFHSSQEDDTLGGGSSRPSGGFWQADESDEAIDPDLAALLNEARQRHRQDEQQQGQGNGQNNGGGNGGGGGEEQPPVVVVNVDDSEMDDEDDDEGDDDDDDEEEGDKDNDEVVTAAQAARYPALALKAYFDTHLHLRATSTTAKQVFEKTTNQQQQSQPPFNLPSFPSSTAAMTPSSACVAPLSPTASSIGPQTLPAPSVHSSLAVVQASPEQRQADLDTVLESMSSPQLDAAAKMAGQPLGIFRKATTSSWVPIQKFSASKGPDMLVQLAHMLIGQDPYTGRTDTLVALFDSLAACCLERSIATSMCLPLSCPRCPDKSSGVISALEATHTDRAGDAAVVKAALSFLTVLCVSANPIDDIKKPAKSTSSPTPTTASHLRMSSTPSTSLAVGARAPLLGTPISRYLQKDEDAGENNLDDSPANVLRQQQQQRGDSSPEPATVFDCIQLNDGIMRLRDLLFTKTPVTEADAIRMHACRVLLGLAKSSETIRQILSRLSLFDHGQLQTLVKDPILQDKLEEHTKFRRYASELAELVSGMRLPTEEEMREQMRRTEIVAKTSYRYDKRELVLLMYSFLRTNGLEDMMKTMLANDGNLSLASLSTPNMNSSGNLGLTDIAPPTMLESLPSRKTRLAAKIPTWKSSPSWKLVKSPSFAKPASVNLLSLSQNSQQNPPPPGVPLPLNVRHSPGVRKPTFLKIDGQQSTSSISPTPPSAHAFHGSFSQSVEHQSKNSDSLAGTLDNIVAAYLRQQHSNCPVPMSICPTFSLLAPHRCPVPLAKATCAPFSLARRSTMCHVTPRWGGPHGRRLNRQFVFGRFQPIRAIRHADHLQFTCCSFLPTVWNGLAVGTDTGDVVMFDSDSGNEAAVFTCHPSPLTNIQFAPWYDSNQLFITSSTWGHPLSALWSMKVPSSGITERDAQPDQKVSLNDDNYVEFGHCYSPASVSSPFLIGTQESIAHLYDLTTGSLLMSLFDAERSSGYSYNRAHLDPADKLVLSDGLLWDVKSKKPIHKFDKLNADISGTFHPSGLEVIINCEVWDLRTYRLLRTVPDLNQCSIVFSGTGDVLYGAVLRSDPEYFASANHPGASRSPFGSMFRTYHADDYSPIASVDVRRTIFDLAVHPDDHTVALVDNDMHSSSTVDGNGDSCVRIYAIGLAHPPDNADGLGDSDREEAPGDDDDDEDDDDDDDSGDDDDDTSLLGSDSSDLSIDDDDDEDDDSGGGRRRRHRLRRPLRLGSSSSRAEHDHSTRSRGGVISPPPLMSGGAGIFGAGGSSSVGSPTLFGQQGNGDSIAAASAGQHLEETAGEDEESDDEDYEPVSDNEDDDDEVEEDDDEDDDDDDESSITISSDDDDDSDDGWSSPRYQLSDRSRSEL